MTFRAIVAFCLFAALSQGCITAGNDAGPLVIQKKTLLPPSFVTGKRSPIYENPQKLEIPEALVLVSKISRKRAEMREGPGINFRLYDKVLPEGSDVMVFQRVGVWQKVLDINSSIVGWVHYQTLAPASKNQTSVRVDSRGLPSVFSVTQIRSAYDVANLKRLSVEIPKGAQFIALGWEKNKVLVYLSETNSLMWLTGQEAK